MKSGLRFIVWWLVAIMAAVFGRTGMLRDGGGVTVDGARGAAYKGTSLAGLAGEKNSNLVVNGTFEEGRSFPVGWEKISSEGSIRWLSSGGNPGRCIVFSLSQGIAEGPGMLYYSDFFPVENGKRYIFSVDIKSDGPVARPFVKGYALAADVHGKIARRQFYQRQSRFTASNEWRAFSMTFTPKVIPAYAGRYDIKWGRVMLYAYLKPGKIHFDNVTVREAPGDSDSAW